MEDKIFELIEKMYNEMQNGFREVRKDIIRLDRKVDDVRQDIVRLENKMDENHKVLYGGYKQNSEAITEIREDIKNLKSRVDN